MLFPLPSTLSLEKKKSDPRVQNKTITVTVTMQRALC